jgi:hypothetical protein
VRTKIQQNFTANNKQKQNKDMRKKTYQKHVLNILKIMGNFTYIYTYWAPNLKNFQPTCGRCSPMCAHVHPCVNYE